MNRFLKNLTGLICLMGLLCSAGLSQEKSQSDEGRRMAAYRETMNPGPEHKQLEALAGSWNTEIKIWPGPGAKPMLFEGNCENRMALGGRFLVSEGKGGQGQMAIENMSIFGFDRRVKKFTSVGYDTEGTYYVTAAGAYDEKEKAIVMTGEEFDPVLNHDQKYRFVLRVVDPDTYVEEVFFADSAHTKGLSEFKAAEITHRRKK